MRNKRFLSLFLSLVMVLSLFPTAAFAAGNFGATASFDPEAIVKGESSYSAELSVDVSGIDDVMGYGMIIDWTDLGGYVESMDVRPNDTLANAQGAYAPDATTGGSYIVNGVSYNLTETQTRFLWNAWEGQSALEGIMLATFQLDEAIPVGTYDVSVQIYELFDGNGDYAVDDSMQSTWVTKTATLTIKNADGTDPEPEVPAGKFAISSVVTSGATTGTVSIATEGVPGALVSFSVSPSTGYEIESVVATDTTNSETLAVNNTSVEGTPATAVNRYSFSMPAGNVQVEVTFKTSTPDNVEDTAYAINVSTATNGSIHTNGVMNANAGDTVTLYVTPNSGYEILSVIVTAETGAAVTVSGGSTQSGDAYLYTFEMPESAVTASATFKAVQQPEQPPVGPGEDVSAGYIKVNGTVVTSNSNPLPGATVQLVYVTGAYIGQVAATTISAEDGTFSLDEVSGDYEYTLQAIYDTGIEKGVARDPGFTVYSKMHNISASSSNVAGEGEVVTQALTITLYYEWDVDGDNNVETIYAGQDDQFLTADDFYQATVAGQTVNVYAGGIGEKNIQSETAYYLWEIDDDGVKNQIFVGGGYKPGTANDYYMYDVDHNPATDDVMVYIAADCEPGTSDDYYDSVDVNNDGSKDTVYAGADGQIATEDDWYKVGDTTIYAGEDKVAGTADDWYMEDTDGATDNDGDEKVYVGKDRLPHTADDFYQEDVNSDGQDESIYAGTDADFNTADDYYPDVVGGKPVNVYPGSTGNDADPYEFGLRDDHYDWSIDGKAIVVRVGDDTQAGTEDDEFDWTITDDDDGEVAVVVIIGEDGIPGTDDDYYMYDADNDGEDEKVVVGEDGIAGTADDYYDEDVNNDGEDERVYAGADEMFDTSDDHYFDEVDGETVDVIAGEDGHIGTADDHFDWTVGGEDVIVYVGEDTQAGTSDDHYDWTITDDDDGDVVVDVIVGEDGIAGTEDDYYAYDADNDGEDEIVNIGEDAIPGTADDNYDEDVNGDGQDETVYAGDDEMFDTSDDHYFDEVDGETVDVIAGEDGHIGTADDNYDWTFDFDGVERPVYVGEDEQAGTSDDWYEYDVNEDGTPEQIEAGEGGIPGTPDDHYAFNADEDAELEDVFVGSDSQPGTSDDYYDEDVNGDGEDERVYAGDDEEFKTPDDYYNALVKDPTDPENTVVVPVYAGEDTIFSDPDNDDSDDYYEYDVDGDGDKEQIFIDGDSFAGTDDDFYFQDVDGDGEDEKVFVGEDDIPMTEDDYYFEDVNGDGEDEQVFAGEDSEFGTEDDFYPEDIDGDGEDEKIFAGEDKDIGSEDDYYDYDVDEDGDDEKVFVGDDRDPGTSDDYYLEDADKDGEDDEIYADGDGIPGTEDDFYEADPDKDGEDEPIYVGPDTKPGTEDDWYEGDPDGDGDDDVIHVGPDTKPGTEDDYYETDVDGDGEPEQIRPGKDEIYGTPDDEYDNDIDKDGEDETIYVGEDTKPGTDDDWYYPIITFNAGNGTVNGQATFSVISSDISALPTASRSGYTFQGWTLNNGSGAILTLEQVLALRADTTVYASYRSNYSGGGGGGGGGVSSYTVKFDSNGGSTVSSQSVVSGGKVTEPTNPTRSGYEFTGWYTDDDCTEKYDFSTKVRKSFTLYAGWEKKQDSVSEKVFRYLTSEHIAYIVGFSDGLVHGDYNMTRAQAATVFYRLLNEETRLAYETTYNRFPDCDANAWYNTAVSTLANLGIIAGYTDGNFGPNDPITRAQFATICARIGELKGDGNINFTDVPANHWAASFIDGAADQGWVVGYGDGKFGPEDYITRSQVVTLLNRVLERHSIEEDSFVDFADDADFRNWPDNMDSEAWDYLALIEAGNGHEYTRDANGVEIWTELTD